MAQALDARRPAPSVPVYLNQDFRVLWLSRTLGQTAANTVRFGSLIIVTQNTGSGWYASLLILAWMLPAAAGGLLSGVVVDVFAKHWILTGANAARAGICLAFLATDQGTAEVYALVVVLSFIGPFVGPAESALVPTLVGRHELTSANAFLNFMRYVAQAAGLALLAPLLMETLGTEAMVIATAALFAGAAVYAALIPVRHRDHDPQFPDEPARWRRGGLRAALRFLKTEPLVFRAAVHLTLLAAVMPLLTALLPIYLIDVLNQKVSDLPIVLVPAIVGMLLGLRLVSLFARHHDVTWLGTVGLLGFVTGLLLLAFIDGLDAALGRVITAGPVALGPLLDLSSGALLAMIIAFPMGIAFSLVTVAADAVLNERVPLAMQGRVFSLQMLIATLASLPPLLAGGALAEVVDVRVVLGLVPLLLAWAWLYARWGTADPREWLRPSRGRSVSP